MGNTLFSSGSALPAHFISLIDELGAYEALWAPENQSFAKLASFLRSQSGKLLSDLVDASVAFKYGDAALARIYAANIPGFGIVLNGIANYPNRLRDAKNPVELLYYSGFWDLVCAPCISVVGSREPSSEGKRIAKRLVKEMVADNRTIVSGLATGIDTVAHETALEEGGTTIGVIGTPITETYPKENKDLQRHIALHHLLISQVPISRYYQQDWRINRTFFPERNVTMSALSQATVIVEASDTSGTLTQARAAIAQGRKLFIMDHCFKRSDISWPQKFLSKGAVRVTGYNDVKAGLESVAG